MDSINILSEFQAQEQSAAPADFQDLSFALSHVSSQFTIQNVEDKKKASSTTDKVTEEAYYPGQFADDEYNFMDESDGPQRE
jgi:hypothetical protein